jgi:hypothetical protein
MAQFHVSKDPPEKTSVAFKYLSLTVPNALYYSFNSRSASGINKDDISRPDNHIKGTSRIPRKEVFWYVRERESIKP